MEIRKLYQHQRQAVKRATEGNLALFHECGTGKTLTALKIIEHHKAMGCGPALVVCPLSIIDAAWMADAAKFAPQLKVVSLWAKTRKKRLEALNRNADIYIINFESFRGLFTEIQAKGFEVLIVDESSKMKSHSSQTTRALLALAGVASRGKGKKFAVNEVIPHRYVLSGTPAPNDRSEYWAQMNFIAPDQVFYENFFAFRSRYFTAVPLGRTGINLWQFTKDKYLADEFNERMAPVCDVVSKADAVDLPEQVHEIRVVELSKPERTAYETFRRELAIRFANEDILASSALVEVMKARQLTSGFCYGQNGTHRVGKSKLTELLSLLEEIGSKPVIIWCSFRHEIQTLLDVLPRSAALWSGTDDRDEVIAGFKDGTYQTLIANPQSAAHGLTFVNCSYAVYFSLTYSYELAKQSQDRIHRIGQDSKCTYYYLIARDTIDEVVYAAVREKKKLSESVLAYLKGTTNGHKYFNSVGTAHPTRERTIMEALKMIWKTIEHHRYTVVCPVIAGLVWATAVGCTPMTPSPVDESKEVNARQLSIEYQGWQAQQKVIEAKFEAAGEDLTEQAEANEVLKQTLLTLASGSVADWSGLVQLLIGGGLLGVIGDNVRKNGVIGGLKRSQRPSV